MEAKKLAMLCRELADDKKAEDIVVLDLRRVSTVADYFVICGGTSEPHLRAIEDEIIRRLKEEHGLKPSAIDGTLRAGWIVLDFFDVVVHLMRSDQRERYDLEGLWGDAPRVRGSRPAAARRPRAPRAARSQEPNPEPGP